jgi:hypothetical protein
MNGSATGVFSVRARLHAVSQSANQLASHSVIWTRFLILSNGGSIEINEAHNVIYLRNKSVQSLKDVMPSILVDVYPYSWKMWGS